MNDSMANLINLSNAFADANRGGDIYEIAHAMGEYMDETNNYDAITSNYYANDCHCLAL